MVASRAMRPGLLAPLLLSLSLACTGRSAGPPGSGSGVSGAVDDAGNGSGNNSGNGGGSGQESTPPADSSTPADPGTPPADPGAAGPACGDKTCAAGEQCISYYGIAGPRGPKFQECGIPCPKGDCPEGKRCQTIADGPGPVCR